MLNLPIPAGFLSLQEIHATDAMGVIIGLMVCCMFCFFASLYILICIENEVREVHRLVERVTEAGLR